MVLDRDTPPFVAHTYPDIRGYVFMYGRHQYRNQRHKHLIKYPAPELSFT